MMKQRNLKAETVRLDRGQGTTCTVNLHGGTIVSWRLAFIEQLFMSKLATLDNLWPIRGGISIGFPNFAYEDVTMPNHGFTRLNKWSIKNEPEVLQNGDVVAEFCLDGNEVLSACHWDYQFKLICSIKLLEQALQISIKVINPSPTVQFNYNISIITYVKVPDVVECDIQGLKDCTFIDKEKVISDQLESNSLVISQCVEQIYLNTPNTICLKKVMGGSIMTMRKSNLPDLGIWNPWNTAARKKVKHFGTDEVVEMICLKPGWIENKVTLQPMEEKESTLVLEIKNQ